MPLRFELKREGIEIGKPFAVTSFEKCHCSDGTVRHIQKMTILDDYIYLERLCSNCRAVEFCGTVTGLEEPGTVLM